MVVNDSSINWESVSMTHLALVTLTRRLVTHDAGLALVTSPALRLKVCHQLAAVHLSTRYLVLTSRHRLQSQARTHPAAGVDALAAAVAADQPLGLAPGVAGLGAQTLGADRDNRGLLRRKQVRHSDHQQETIMS